METNTKLRIALSAFLLMSGSIAVASDFVSYEGKDAVQEGRGGEKRTVDGVDFWANGAPPRKFKIIGFITDTRHKTGLIGMIRMSGLDSSVAKEAKKAGGDAVILTYAEAETTGHVGFAHTNSEATANTSGNMNATTIGNSTSGSFGATTTAQGQSSTTSFSRAVQEQHSKYAVIKYLPDESN